MAITQIEAKALTLKTWRYLRDNPDLRAKYELPSKVYEKIEDFKNECPLCELFFHEVSGSTLTPRNQRYQCPSCPLAQAGEQCWQSDHSNDNGKVYPRAAYEVWAFSSHSQERIKGASRIVEVVEAWEPKETA